MDQLPNVPSTFTEFLWEILTVSDENDQNANEEPEPVSVQPDSATLQDQGDTVEPSSAHVHEPFEFFSPIDTNENLEIILKDIEGTSSITSCIENYDQIAKNLLKSECFPSRLRFSNNWRLIFSTEKHGVSFSTFYDRMDAYSEDSYDGSSSCPLVLVVKDDAGKIFGAFVTDAWRRNSGSGQFKSDTSVAGGIGRCYYGTGEW